MTEQVQRQAELNPFTQWVRQAERIAELNLFVQWATEVERLAELRKTYGVPTRWGVR